MLNYVRNFAELPFHGPELKFGGYIRDGVCSVTYIQAVAETYGLKVHSFMLSLVHSLTYLFFQLIPVKVHPFEHEVLSRPWVKIGDVEILFLENELPAGTFFEMVCIIPCSYAIVLRKFLAHALHVS